MSSEYNRRDNEPDDDNMTNTPPSDDMGDRLERLGGEPAPAITPEEFERLQKAGQVHIDSRVECAPPDAAAPKRAFPCASVAPGMREGCRIHRRLRHPAHALHQKHTVIPGRDGRLACPR